MRSIPPVCLLAAMLAATTLVALAATPVSAQEERPDLQEEHDRAPVDHWGFEIRLDGMLFDNFFQAPDDRESTTVRALRGIGKVEFRPGANGNLSLFAGGGGTIYNSGLDDSTTILGGLQVQAHPHDLSLQIGRESNRPILDVGDELETADVLFVDGEYGYRVTDDWELKGLLGLQSQTFEVTSAKDNTILGVGPAVRYRGFGYGFSPEVGVLFGGRSATDPSEDHSQTDLYVKVRSAPSPDLYLSFRLRRRIRDYSIEDVGERNFGREDRRTQLTGLLVYPTDAPLALTLYYAYQNADSTLPSRTFSTQMVIFGVTVALN